MQNGLEVAKPQIPAIFGLNSIFGLQFRDEFVEFRGRTGVKTIIRICWIGILTNRTGGTSLDLEGRYSMTWMKNVKNPVKKKLAYRIIWGWGVNITKVWWLFTRARWVRTECHTIPKKILNFFQFLHENKIIGLPDLLERRNFEKTSVGKGSLILCEYFWTMDANRFRAELQTQSLERRSTF